MTKEAEPVDWASWGWSTPDRRRAAEAAKYYASPEYAAAVKERIDREYTQKRTKAEHEAKMAKLTAESEARDEAERKRPLLELEDKVAEVKTELNATAELLAASVDLTASHADVTAALMGHLAAPKIRTAVYDDKGNIVEMIETTVPRDDTEAH